MCGRMLAEGGSLVRGWTYHLLPSPMCDLIPGGLRPPPRAPFPRKSPGLAAEGPSPWVPTPPSGPHGPLHLPGPRHRTHSFPQQGSGSRRVQEHNCFRKGSSTARSAFQASDKDLGSFPRDRLLICHGWLIYNVRESHSIRRAHTSRGPSQMLTFTGR